MIADLVIDVDRGQLPGRQTQSAPQNVQKHNRVHATTEADRNFCGFAQAGVFKR